MNQRRRIARTISVFIVTGLFTVTARANDLQVTSIQPIDTQYIPGENQPRAFASGKGKDSLMVPLVDVDSSPYYKKLWFGESQLIHPPEWETNRTTVAAKDSVIVIVFSNRFYVSKNVIPHRYELIETVSADCGRTWSDISRLHYTCQTTGRPNMGEYLGELKLVHHTEDEDEVNERRLVYRGFDSDLLTWPDSVRMDEYGFPDDYVDYAHLACLDDTLFISWYHVDYIGNRYKFCQSADSGATWEMMDAEVPPGEYPRLLSLDSSLVLIDEGILQIYCRLSHNHGQTWGEQICLSETGRASQHPSSSSDGKADLHVSWYDFQGVSEAGWGGYPYYTRSLDGGATWSPLKSFSDLRYVERTEICAEDDYVYTAWNWGSSEESPNFCLNMRCSRNRGDTWTPPIVFEDTYKAWDCDVYAQGDYIYLTWWEQHPPDWIRNSYFRIGAWYVPGDVDMTGEIDIADLVFLVIYMFCGGPKPWIMGTTDVDGNGVGPDIADLVYLVNYMFNGGPAPVGAPQPWE